MKSNKRFMKSVATTVMVAQLGLAMQPLMAATRDDKGAGSPMAQAQLKQLQALQRSIDEAKAVKAVAQQSPADRASTQLARVEELVRDLVYLADESEPGASSAGKAGQEQVRAIGQNIKAKVRPLTDEQKAQRQARRAVLWDELKGLLAKQSEDQAAVRAEFAQTRKMLVERKLPAVILGRHDEAVKQFEQRVAQFNQSVAKVSADQKVAVAELKGFFDQYPTKRRPAPSDPKNLPWRTPEPTKRMPAETQTAWFQNLYGKEGTRLAQVGNNLAGLEFITPPEPGAAPTAADLAETPETQRTAAIVAKAQELGNNPVNIQNWVRNNVEWVPTWGAIQSAEDTLNKKRGNAIDIASLEIALLRAAKIPARYQFGTIELPSAQVMNWVGGVQKPEAAQQLLGQGGIANRGLIEGGRISKIRMEHAWVQAYVNWVPSRGAKQGSATQHPNPLGQRNAWVPLDASFKQYSYMPAKQFEVNLPQTAQALWSSFLADASVNEFEGSIKGGGIYALENNIQDYSSRSAEVVRQQMADPNYKDLQIRKIVSAVQSGVISGVVPYSTLGSKIAVPDMPDQLIHKFTLKLYGSSVDRATDSPQLMLHLPLHKLSKKLAIRYRAASLQDQSLLDEYKGRAPGLPAYLIRMVGFVELDGQVVADIPVASMGSEQYWSVDVFDPSDGSSAYDFKVIGSVGDEAVIGVNAAGIVESDYPKAQGVLSPSETLHVASLNYWGYLDKIESMLSLASEVVVVRMPSFGFFAQSLNVTYSWGVARSAYYSGRMMDVRRSLLSVVAKNGDTHRRNAFLDAEGAIASYFEGAIYDVMFGHGVGESVSAVSALMQANQSGQKIFRITQDNMPVVESQLSNLSVSTRETVSDAVAAGAEVLVSEAPVLKGQWQGAGIVIKDRDGNGRAYLIDGGSNGSQESQCDRDRQNEPRGVEVTDILSGLARLFLVLLAILIAAAVVACALGTMGICGGAAAPVAGAVGGLFLTGVASAQALNFVSVSPLNGYGQVGWSVSYGKLYQWPRSAPDYVNRTCSEELERSLGALKEAACSGPRSCSKAQPCLDYKVRIDNGLRCAGARIEVMKACYGHSGGFGDQPHWNELKNVIDVLGKCMCYSGEGACQIVVGD